MGSPAVNHAKEGGMHCLTRRLAPALFPLVFAVAGGAHAETHTVVMQFFQFKPQTLEVKPGDQVEWVNRDVLEHTATGANGTFDSKAIKAGQRWKWTASAPGQYAYECAFHPSMKGVITVKP
jgi:plastocyanin